MDSNAKDGEDVATRNRRADSNGAAAPGTSKKKLYVAKVKRHCRKFWWLDFLVIAGVALAINLPLYVLIARRDNCYHMNQDPTEPTTDLSQSLRRWPAEGPTGNEQGHHQRNVPGH